MLDDGLDSGQRRASLRNYVGMLSVVLLRSPGQLNIYCKKLVRGMCVLKSGHCSVPWTLAESRN